MKTFALLPLACALIAVTAHAAPPKQAAIVTKGKNVSSGNLSLNIATIPTPPTGTTQVDRGSSGSIDRQTYTTPTGTVITRDGRGRIIASSTTTTAGETSTTTHRDGDGRIIGNTYKSPTGTEYTRNARGVITTTATTTTAGETSTTTYRDGSGRIIGTKYVSPIGSVTYRDGDGRITGPDFK
ncbi:hypothetical protein [Roseimicrobium sp. ORNL1]|uniref:hypothetical protein n=1 Tax=Roseimicrobium sp. ORNL1 TaxID=2711231 RepID=UPI0013E16350|nr:hypothetical protein [Roseimicrobium sp. ORNL1]QIF01152.1 hypothetical protein G5S37_06340 [Roseimicrobium sp. ORNL1]